MNNYAANRPKVRFGKIPPIKINRAAVQRSLKELALLFGKDMPATKDNTQRELGAGNTEQIRLKSEVEK